MTNLFPHHRFTAVKPQNIPLPVSPLVLLSMKMGLPPKTISSVLFSMVGTSPTMLFAVDMEGQQLFILIPTITLVQRMLIQLLMFLLPLIAKVTHHFYVLLNQLFGFCMMIILFHSMHLISKMPVLITSSQTKEKIYHL